MAFPYLVHENWSGGSAAVLTSETDTNNAGTVMHFSRMAEREPGLYPLAGDAAFGYVVDLKRANGAAAYMQGTISVAAGSTAYLAFPCMISENIEAEHGDAIVLAELLSGGTTSELAIEAVFDDARGWLIGVSTDGGSFDRDKAAKIDEGEVYHVELKFTVGNTTDGTAQLFLEDEEAGAAFTGLTHAAFDTLRIGNVSTDVIQHGYVVFGEVILDDAQVFPMDDDDKFDKSFVVDKSCHLFVGEGEVIAVELELGNSDNAAVLYDTDRAEAWRGHIRALLNSELKVLPTDEPVDFMEGAYLVLSGTNPRAVVRLGEVAADTPEEVVELGREVAETDPYVD